MQADNIKVLFTYTIATLVITVGMAILYLSRLDPPESNSQNLSLVMAGFIGAAIQFVFNRETQTSTARQVERATAAGAASQPNIITNATPPNVTTTIVPSTPITGDNT
jgi:uncharacterized protein involved in response to NO